MCSSVSDPPSEFFKAMNPAQQHAPCSEELCLAVVEQALADSIAREIETQKTLALLTNSFQLLRELVQTHIPLCTSLKIPSMDITCLVCPNQTTTFSGAT